MNFTFKKSMVLQSDELIHDLMMRTKTNIKEAQKFEQYSIQDLNHRNTPESWSILECIEHLNLYGDFYLPEITKKIQVASKGNYPHFKSGWLGNYFAKSMLPKEKLNTMKTFKDKNPIGSSLDKNCITKFIHQQEEMIQLLERAKRVNLTKTKTAISISKWIKLRLGDTFRVVIYHNDRHMIQANAIL